MTASHTGSSGSGPDRPKHAVTTVATLAVAAVGVAWLWLRFNAEPPDRGSLFPHDLLYYFHPALDEMGRRFAAGELPLWSRDGCAGRPLLAALQPAVFYPPHWLSAWLPATTLLEWTALGHALLAATGGALCLRRFGTPGALAGALGVVFTFACVLGQSFWPPEAAVLAWWPVVLLCADHALDEERVGPWALALAFATAAQLLAGFPQLTLYGAGMIALWVIGRSVFRLHAGDAKALGALARVVGVAILGAGIAGAQLGASSELLAESNRSERFAADEVHYLQQQARAATVLARSVDPTPALRSFELPGAAPGYLGVGTLVFGVLALWTGRRRARVRCLALLGAAALLLADGHLGIAAPVYRALSEIPGLGHFRAPERLLFVAFACAIGLAGQGARSWVDAIRTRAQSREGSRAPRAAAAVIGGTCVAVAAAGPPEALVHAGIAATIGIVPLLAPVPERLRGRLVPGATALAALLVIVDVGIASVAAGSFRSLPGDWAREPHVAGARVLDEASLARLQRERPARAELVGRNPELLVRPLGTPLPGGIERLACYETLLGAGWPALSEALVRRDYKSAQASNLDPDRHDQVYAMASVGLVGVLEVESRETFQRDRRRHAGAFARGAPLRDGPPRGTRVHWHAVDALPRAYRIEHWEVVESLDETVARIAAGDFDPRRSVLIDAAPTIEMTGGSATPIAEAARVEPVRILRRDPEHVRLETRGERPALVVLTDSAAPGWHARIDGEEAPVLRANGLFRAVAVPPGAHELRFDYQPIGLRAGAAVSLASLLVLAGLAVRGRRSRR